MTSTPIRQLRVQLITTIAVIMVSLWGTVAYQLASERGAALRTAAQHGKNLSGIVAEHFSSYAGAADLLLQHLRTQWTRDPKRFAEAVAVEKGFRKDVFVVQVAVIGADGWVAYTDLPAPKERVFLGDREHFKTHRSAGPDQLYISGPVKGRVSGKLSIQFTRRILDRNGRFAGVLVLSVSPQALIRVYEGLDLGANGLVAISAAHRARRTPKFHRAPPQRAPGAKSGKAVSTESNVFSATAGSRISPCTPRSASRSIRFSRISAGDASSTCRREPSDHWWCSCSGS